MSHLAGGVAIFTFSNRMFYSKAIAAWREAPSGYARVQLVKQVCVRVCVNCLFTKDELPCGSA